MSERESLNPSRLRENADLTEKAIEFMADPEQIEEAKADIALWREAADEIETLRAALREEMAWDMGGVPENEYKRLARVRGDALVMAGGVIGVLGEWFLTNKGDANLERLVTPELREAISAFEKVADQIEASFV